MGRRHIKVRRQKGGNTEGMMSTLKKRCRCGAGREKEYRAKVGRGCLHPEESYPRPRSHPISSPSPRGTLLLLGIIHADLKDGGPLASQKGHSGRCATCAPFQAVDTATPILGPEEVVAMVTQAKGVVQLRTLIHNLGMEGRLVRSWGQQGPSVRPGGNHCFVHSFAHVLSGGPISPISLGAPDGNRFSHSEMPDPVPSRMLMVNLFILLSLGPIHIHSHPSNTSVCTHVHVYMHMHTQSTGQSQNSSIHFLLQETFAGSIKGQAVVGTKE